MADFRKLTQTPRGTGQALLEIEHLNKTFGSFRLSRTRAAGSKPDNATSALPMETAQGAGI